MLHIISNLTLNNPIFMIVFFGVLWYLPGLIINRRRLYIKERDGEINRKERISKLYPRDNSDTK